MGCLDDHMRNMNIERHSLAAARYTSREDKRLEDENVSIRTGNCNDAPNSFQLGYST